MFTRLNRHAYFYVSARHVAKGSFETDIFQSEKQGELHAFCEWQPWAGDVAPGTFYHEDLRALRRELLCKEINANVP